MPKIANNVSYDFRLFSVEKYGYAKRTHINFSIFFFFYNSHAPKKKIIIII